MDRMPSSKQSAVSISVIVPLFNGGEGFIRRALVSVASQTLPPNELIVIDEGSNDNSAAIVDEFSKTCPVRLLHKRNGGLASARNFGVAHSRCDLIALLDQDDFWYPSHLAELVEPFRQKRSRPLGWVYSNVDEIDRDGKFISHSLLTTLGVSHPKTEILECLGNDMYVPTSASLISRRAFETIGGFDERLSGYSGDDLFLRLLVAGYDNVFIDLPLSGWGQNPNSTLYSAEAAVGRMEYARKLLAAYPLDDARSISVRDSIISRFIIQVAEAMRMALRVGDTVLADAYRSDIESLEYLATKTQPFPLLRTNLLTTVVIPLHNGKDTIEKALRSVGKQTLLPDEIIVVDDGSTDGGASIVEHMGTRYPVTLLTKLNGGLSSARNLGVQHAHGDLIALLDQDDVWYPTHLAELTKPFREPRLRPLGWVHCDIDEIAWTGKLLTQSVLKAMAASRPTTSVEGCLRGDLFVIPSASVICRRAFEAVGGFDETLSCYEDEELFLRLLHAGYDNIYVDRALTGWRMHPPTSATSERNASSRMTYLRKLLKTFPDEAHSKRHPVRDLVAPRFLPDALSDVRTALRIANYQWLETCFKNLHFIEGLLDKHRLGFDQREPLISAVVLLNNGAPFIKRAICSVLAQTLEPDEIIVVDYGSTDNGPTIVERMACASPIRLIRQGSSGQKAARHAGVEQAHGDLIAFLDQDDLWYPNHLAELAKPFLERQSARLGCVYSNVDEIDQDGRMVCRNMFDDPEGRLARLNVVGDTSAATYLVPSACMISAQAYRVVSQLDAQLSEGEENDLFIRLFSTDYDNVYLHSALSAWRPRSDRTSYSVSRRVSRVVPPLEAVLRTSGPRRLLGFAKESGFGEVKIPIRR